MSVLFETTVGNIVIDVLHEREPLLSYNFLKLCKAQYYFFSPFFNLRKDDVVFCGDPEFPKGDGGCAISEFGSFRVDSTEIPQGKFITVDPSKVSRGWRQDEGVGSVYFLYQKRQNTSEVEIGSQFFISLSADERAVSMYEGLYFGKVAEGFSALEKINESVVEIETHRLIEDIRILHAHILYDPFENPSFMEQISRSKWPTENQISTLRNNRMFNQNKDVDNTIMQALSLELMGDLPRYDIKPSPQTLFVAKLNPVTNLDSLSIFFGRFGAVKQSNVVLDKEKKKSLCYGFVEFETQEDAENAYTKLQKGCMIDGRDIVVDFSQSVSRMNILDRNE